MAKTCLALFLIFLWFLLMVHALFTVITIFTGGVPIPSFKSTVKKMMRLADVKPGEFLMDLGSGDGRVLVAAARLGARCVGYEINPLLIWYSRLVLKLRGLREASVRTGNFWKADLSDVDVVTLYISQSHMPKLKEKIQSEMRPGTRVVSAVFTFPDWEPEAVDGKVYLYRV